MGFRDTQGSMGTDEVRFSLPVYGRVSFNGQSLDWFFLLMFYEGMGLGLGLLSLYYFAKVAEGPSGGGITSALGWPEVQGLTTGTSIMGSALSFLLVFRLSWSFGRWWEARGLIGTATTKMPHTRARCVGSFSNVCEIL